MHLQLDEGEPAPRAAYAAPPPWKTKPPEEEQPSRLPSQPVSQQLGDGLRDRTDDSQNLKRKSSSTAEGEGKIPFIAAKAL